MCKKYCSQLHRMSSPDQIDYITEAMADPTADQRHLSTVLDEILDRSDILEDDEMVNPDHELGLEWELHQREGRFG